MWECCQSDKCCNIFYESMQLLKGWWVIRRDLISPMYTYDLKFFILKCLGNLPQNAVKTSSDWRFEYGFLFSYRFYKKFFIAFIHIVSFSHENISMLLIILLSFSFVNISIPFSHCSCSSIFAHTTGSPPGGGYLMTTNAVAFFSLPQAHWNPG